ncbi:T9SS type A sorting domain-containing protein [Hymenobacter cellulosivorans]|uniref:T9SS type A sorting domain-containing protein n=1 Tax=Hymenobacter cellulosivorans TaxID=2932249 RepID=A0ABY4F2J6_9BACT|nr:T9SS type A sorting domain-containing protein [Hymenobacter cellulosivorans]UOQ50775.1 T9SS type A sorting domain-containing protein [Hymenobacter cellulosivorans]
MKYYLPAALLLGALLTGLTATAQTGPITLTQANFPANATAVDRYLPMHGALHPGFVLPQPGPGQVWDYSTLTADSSALEQTYLPPPATGPFAAATRSYVLPAPSTQNYALPHLGLWTSFTGQGFDVFTPSVLPGIGNPPVTIGSYPQQQWAIERADRTPGDFLQLPAQNGWYESRIYPPLPLTATSSERGIYHTIHRMEVTVRDLGLNAAKVRVAHHVTTQTDVVGYGTLKLPKPAGGSVSVPVLMVRTHILTLDTAYINRQLAPAVVLQALRMEQAVQRRDIYQTAFYRENSSQPALLLYHTNASFSTLRNYFSIWFSGEDNLRVITGVRPVQARAGTLQVYPNPVTDGRLTLELPGEQQAVQLIVRDALGRQVATGATLTGQPSTVLRELRAGLYVVEATTPVGQRSTVRVRVE